MTLEQPGTCADSDHGANEARTDFIGSLSPPIVRQWRRLTLGVPDLDQPVGEVRGDRVSAVDPVENRAGPDPEPAGKFGG